MLAYPHLDVVLDGKGFLSIRRKTSTQARKYGTAEAPARIKKSSNEQFHVAI
jgi:hypothetical protein